MNLEFNRSNLDEVLKRKKRPLIFSIIYLATKKLLHQKDVKLISVLIDNQDIINFSLFRFFYVIKNFIFYIKEIKRKL